MNIIEAIIELLIANIAFVILIAGGIYSFLKRLNDTKETNRPKPIKQVKEHPKQTVSPFGVPNEADRSLEREPTITVEKIPDKADKINQRYEMIKKENSSNRYQDKEAVILEKFTVNQEELQKAVIWSEILSKPKALQKRY